MLRSDVLVMAILALIILSILILLWKEFKLITFDADYGKVLGFPKKRLEFLLTFLISLPQTCPYFYSHEVVIGTLEHLGKMSFRFYKSETFYKNQR